MIINLHKTKTYAFMKGLIDSGVEIKFDKKKDIFPSEERIKGELKRLLEKKIIPIQNR